MREENHDTRPPCFDTGCLRKRLMFLYQWVGVLFTAPMRVPPAQIMFVIEEARQGGKGKQGAYSYKKVAKA